MLNIIEYVILIVWKKVKCWKIKGFFFALTFLDIVLILLVNVKMSTIVGVLIFMRRINDMLH